MSEEIPLCECHNEPKSWEKSNRYLAGGYWRCRIKKRERQQRFHLRHGEEIREYKRVRYRKSKNDQTS